MCANGTTTNSVREDNDQTLTADKGDQEETIGAGTSRDPGVNAGASANVNRNNWGNIGGDGGVVNSRREIGSSVDKGLDSQWQNKR